MPIYVFEHPETGERFEVFRTIKNASKPFRAPDGVKCQRVITSCMAIIKGKEVWEYNDVKDVKPKYVRNKHGKKEKYDPTKHF